MDPRHFESPSGSAPREAPFWPSGHLFGHIKALETNPLDTLMRAQRERGDLVRVRLGYLTAFFVYAPKDVKQVLVQQTESFTKTTRGYKKLRLIVGNGLINSEGSFWRRQRRIAQPAFRKRCIAGFAQTMVSASTDLVDRWHREVESGTVIDISSAMNALAFRMAGETLMSVDVTNAAQLISDAIDIVMPHFTRLVSSPLPYPEYWPTPGNFRFWRALRQIRGVVDGIIEDRRQSDRQVPDLLGMFMAAEDAETGASMTDSQLRDEVITMLTAGHETTANALGWTLLQLARHPTVARTLEAELDSVLGTRPVGLNDLQSLPYTRQVLKESMRLHPPVWVVVRQASRETELSGYRIPKGSYIFMPQWAIHRHPDHWPDPEVFDPDRFGPDRPEPDRFAYFPFSRGKRQCIGDRFAEMEGVLALATLVQHYRFELAPHYTVEYEASITLRPREGIKMRLIRRHPD